MNTKLSPQALKAQDDAREASGRFGTQLHPENPMVTIGAPEPTYRERAVALAAQQRETAEALSQEANLSLVSVAACSLADTHPHIMAVTFDYHNLSKVSQAWDENSDTLPEEDRQAVQEAFRAAGVKPDLDFSHPGIHLHRMRDWEPHEFVRSTDRAVMRAERAMAAGSTGAPENTKEQMESLLADLRHLASKEGIDFDSVVVNSGDHFDTEQAEDRLIEEDRRMPGRPVVFNQSV